METLLHGNLHATKILLGSAWRFQVHWDVISASPRDMTITTKVPHGQAATPASTMVLGTGRSAAFTEDLVCLAHAGSGSKDVAATETWISEERKCSDSALGARDPELQERHFVGGGNARAFVTLLINNLLFVHRCCGTSIFLDRSWVFMTSTQISQSPSIFKY